MKINEKHLVAFVNNNAPIDKEGYLHKKGEVNKAFQKRWFVMKGNLLFYFDKRGDRDPIGIIILESCTVELGDSTDNYAFDLNFKGSGSRTYTLAADTQEEMESWMKSITCAGYEYMKLMVNELQRQLDELNNSERGHSFRSSMGREPPRQTQSDIAQSVLRNSTSHEQNNLLIDITDSGGSDGKSQTNLEKRKARINPFDTNGSRTSDTVIARAAPIPPELASDALTSNNRNFDQLHSEFGDYIKHKCNLKSGENVL